MERPDIHGYDLRLRGAYWAIERSSMIPENKEAIREFAKVLESMGLNKGRIAKYVYHLIALAST